MVLQDRMIGREFGERAVPDGGGAGGRLRDGVRVTVLVWLAAFGSAAFSQTGAPSAGDVEFFEREIRPLLAEQCYSCHSAKIETPFAGLRVDSREALLKGGESGAAILPGDPENSRLIKLLRGEPLLMPPTGRLSDERIAALGKWIKMGAPWPEDEPAPEPQAGDFDLEARKSSHWAWQPVAAVEPPAVSDEGWPAGAVDRFLLAKLDEERLKPASSADGYSLIRRLSFDLTGLPPTPEQIRAFVQDKSPDAYPKLVRRLLDSPHFGERWARHWMDLVRYSESHGSEGDPEIPVAWRYRNYLIRALNKDVPYDQLVREHLAGDLIENPRLNPSDGINESVVGTAHFRMVEHAYQPVEPWEDRVKFVDNQIDVFSKAFQGLTVSCARCHDHKFDAISQKDYYALFGMFYGARPTQRAIDDPATLHRHRDELIELKAEIRSELAKEWLAAAKSLGRRLSEADSAAVRRAFGAAACEQDSPLQVWNELRNKRGDALRASWRNLLDRGRETTQAHEKFNQEKFEIWDLTGDDYDKWVGHGSGLPEKPSGAGEFRVLHEGDRVIEGLYPGGVYTHLLSTKHNGVMQSPRFKIDTDYISVRVLGGDMSYARLMVENYAVPLSGIYSQRYSPRSDEMRWWRWKTDFWKGFTAYVEFTTHEDSTNFFLDAVDRRKKPRPKRPKHGRSAIGAAAVAFHDGEDEPKETVSAALYLLEGEAPGSAEELGELLGRRLTEAIEAWRVGRLDEHEQKNDEQAAFLDYFVRKDLLPRSLESLESVRPLVEEYRRLEAEIPIPRRAPGVLEEGAPDQPLLIRGNHKQPGEAVPRRYLSAVGGSLYESPRTVRARLADEIASPGNPLTARVMANRIWYYLFGRGIVATPDNFGAVGERPSHPELLDFLADRFIKDGWSIKKTVERLVSTRAYRMSSKPSGRAREIDPLNKWLQHMPARRLDAEAIRDSLLAVSGKLDPTMYGAPVSSQRAYFDEEAKSKPKPSPYGDDRRSVYQEVRRNVHNPLLEAFDQPSPATTRGQRDVTNVPAQSLALMNSPFVTGLAEEWGSRLANGEAHSADMRVEYMFLKAFGRRPLPEERDRTAGYLADLAKEHGVSESAILGNAKVWRAVAHSLFNFKEFIYIR